MDAAKVRRAEEFIKFAGRVSAGKIHPVSPEGEAAYNSMQSFLGDREFLFWVGGQLVQCVLDMVTPDRKQRDRVFEKMANLAAAAKWLEITEKVGKKIPSSICQPVVKTSVRGEVH